MTARDQEIGGRFRQRNFRIGDWRHGVLQCLRKHVDGDIDPALLVSDGIDMARGEAFFFRVVSTRVLFGEAQAMPMVRAGNKRTTTYFKRSPDFTPLK